MNRRCEAKWEGNGHRETSNAQNRPCNLHPAHPAHGLFLPAGSCLVAMPIAVRRCSTHSDPQGVDEVMGDGDSDGRYCGAGGLVSGDAISECERSCCEDTSEIRSPSRSRGVLFGCRTVRRYDRTRTAIEVVRRCLRRRDKGVFCSDVISWDRLCVCEINGS
jgi:hypothetical protein